jgi:precorrin-3B C17-methyltransferase
LIADLIEDKELMSSTMTRERERCEVARDTALTGKPVAMVSSGDAGIYGMASLMLEVCADFPQIEIEVIPGVTAASAAAATLGAPLTHDFAVISLSDLLTPWEIIAKRLKASAESDFVICLYNPSSKKRADYLKRACNILLAAGKSPDTPCGTAKNLSRDGQQTGILTLEQLSDFQADMFTTIIVGNSQTALLNGRLVTPRGY